ncbi:MAG: protein kinase [Candidatus Xenobiia bacterium LiM19]
MENDMEPLLSIGTVLKSRYEVTAPLGKGGISSVFRAVDSITGHPVAIKVIREDTEILKKKPLSLSRHPLGIEYSLLSRLSHRQLPSVSDLFIEGDYVCMVMEFIEGQTLGEMMESLLCTDFTAIFRIFYQVLGTLSFLNRQKIIYRDLKPSNILIVQQKIVKLVDFGAARRYSRFKKSDTVPLGTVGFASPEHYGYRQTDERSEVYTAGALLYYLTTGCNPADTPFRLQEPTLHNTAISSRLADIIKKATSLDREQRFSTMRELYLCLRDAAGELLGRERLLYCPVCWEMLETITLGKVDIDLCGSCGGLWCDSAELEQLEKMDPWQFESASRQRYSGETDDGGRESRTLVCPACSAPLSVCLHRKGSHVWLDRCALGCGTWLDGGELLQIVQDTLHGSPSVSPASQLLSYLKAIKTGVAAHRIMAMLRSFIK